MNSVPSPRDPSAAGAMLVLFACWGLQQVAIKIVTADVAPVMQMKFLVLTIRFSRREFSPNSIPQGLRVLAFAARDCDGCRAVASVSKTLASVEPLLRHIIHGVSFNDALNVGSMPFSRGSRLATEHQMGTDEKSATESAGKTVVTGCI